MIELDVTFNDRPLETLLASLKRGRTLSAVRLLTLSVGEDEQTFIDALEVLEEKCVALDLAGLTVPPAGPEAAVRLRMEAKLAREGMQWERLDPTDPLRIYLQELAQQCDEMPSTDVYAWMLEKGISKRTTEEAKKLVGIASVRHGNRLYFDLRPLRIPSLEEA